MAEKKEEIRQRQRQRQRQLLILSVSVVGVLLLAALLHVGAGDAEWMGMSVSNITPAIAMEFGVPKDEKGVVVNWCEDPAYSSGIREGDLLKSVNNQKTDSISKFLKCVKMIDIRKGVLVDVLRNGQPIYITLENSGGLHDTVKRMLGMDLGANALDSPPAKSAGNTAGPAAIQAAFANTSPAETQEAKALNPANNVAPGPQGLPSPKEQGAATKELIEGHWLGMELIPLTPELAAEFKIPAKTKGVLVDEISLEAAESGVLAGDMVVAIDRYATPDLVAFTEATRRAKNNYSAKVLVSRRGEIREFIISSKQTLGFSQNEAAQPITPGALSPHRSRNKPCTACHIIMITGGQLPTDAGDILPSPPPITKGAVAIHEYRGKCNNCHVILKK
ncbi:MAG: hypothetical protein HQL30_09575 [Candidatus Omnitrophica bacterium]|nr:hypothetical protein [Candidatus Omnitrophota bacterium]